MSTAVRTACINWPSKDFKPAIPILIINATAATLEREKE
jgi:hypothetical protein